MSDAWQLDGTSKDTRGITSDWELVDQELLEGVVVHEVKSVPTGYGHLAEIYREDWKLDPLPVDQVFQSVLEPGGRSAWHAHALTTDRLFAVTGMIRIVLYDPRPASPTHGRLNEFRFGAVRRALVVVPPQVWHGIENLATQPSVVLNVVDRAYCYDDPDHYRLPEDSLEIPYRWSARR